MELIWSTATFRPSNSKTWSASVVWFSNAMWYWKPEQPPPTTATRSAVGTGLCMLMISLTLVLATGVKLIINPLGLRSQAHPRSYQQLHYTRTLIRVCNPVCLALKRVLSPYSGSRGRANRLGRDRGTLRQLRRPGKNRQPGRRGIRAQEPCCAEGPHGHGHRRRCAQRERRAA